MQWSEKINRLISADLFFSPTGGVFFERKFKNAILEIGK